MNNLLHTTKFFIVFIFILFLGLKSVFSQVTTVDISSATNGTTVNTCGAALHDSGSSSTGYSDNENYILTICPDVPGDVITIDFTSFNLDPTNTVAGGPCGGNADNISFWDGDDMSATPLGTYTCTSLAGQLVTCTSANVSGCLTIRFKSNSTGSGTFNYSGSITCSTPCSRPTAVLASPMPGEVQKICVGESLTFNGTPSYPATGFTIVKYLWNFGDGTIDSTSGPVVSHTFTTIGEHLVDLFIFDDNNCAASNLVTVPVWVGTTPTFTGTTTSQVLCTGASMCLDGQVNSVTYTGQPLNITGDSLYIPDDVGFCFSSELNVNLFSPGATLTDISDLLGINVNMEHSYMGDMVISVTCPDGTSVILHDQGGGGTLLGEPVDVSSPASLDPPGIGYDYSWSPYSTAGTWVAASSGGGFGTPLPPGDYESVFSLDSLVGCPLNGTWSFEICDLLGSDDGWVFGWGLDFNPALYPDITEYTPIYGADADSTYWTALDAASNAIITSISPDADQLCAATTAPGVYSFQYHATDDFGCTYDTIITLTYNLPPTVDAGPDQIACPGQIVDLNAIATSNVIGGADCTYTVNMFDTFGDGWNGYDLEIVVGGVVISNITMTTGSTGVATFNVPSGVSFSINSNSGSFDTEVSFNIVDPNGNTVYTEGPGVTAGLNIYSGTSLCFDVEWTPTTDLSNPNILNPQLTASVPTTLIVSVNENGCMAFDTVRVDISSTGILQMLGPDTSICNPQSIIPHYIVSTDSNAVYTWTCSDMSTISDPSAAIPTLVPTTTTTYSLSVTLPSGCTYRDEFQVFFIPVPTNIGTGADDTICQGQMAPLTVVGGVHWNWIPDFNLSCDDCPDPVATPTTTTNYFVRIITEDGCYYDDSIKVYVNPMPSINATPTISQAYLGESVNLVADGVHYNYILWEPSTYLSDTNSANTLCTPLSSMTYFVTAYNLDSTCVDQDTVYVEYMGCRGFKVPSAFSPNGDNFNDVFYVFNSGFEDSDDFSFAIYNRWGQEVFKTTNIGEGWDGTYNNLEQEIGTYVYYITGKCEEEVISVKGNVTLVR